MINQQYLKYDVITGNITDGNNRPVTTMLGFEPIDFDKIDKKSTSVDDMIKLKNSGFTAEEVIAIKKANL